ncbi:unnamed protein product [Staurois parvus]|uniref:Uncharacterized protein n=1 Tax=Staurois parvus TaxID=386267 RepID=A0ABN9DUL1_9NEOB|nr:unnamed protein product [Staurois parvus]
MALHSRAIQSNVLRVDSTQTAYCETAHSKPYMLTPSFPVSLV